MKTVNKICTLLAAFLLMAFVAPLTGCNDEPALIQKPLPPIVDSEDPGDPGDPGTPAEPTVVLRIVDANATPETKALYANLWKMQNEGKTMFGHHDGLMYGINEDGSTWKNVPGRSDTKQVCGEHAAIYSLDFAPMMDGREAITSSDNQLRLRLMKEAYARGEVITACIHLNNPGPGGGDSWKANWSSSTTEQDKRSPWPDIIQPGTAIHTKFMGWLDNLANMANNLKDENGVLIPVIFRPFHEHTQTWAWWHGGTSAFCNQSQFIELWRMTIRYLRDEKGVHNFLYSISPQRDSHSSVSSSKTSILYWWMGDEWVDFLGMDCYHGTGYSSLTGNLQALDEISQDKMKPCGVTEMGVEGTSAAGGAPTSYWTSGVITPFTNRKAGTVVMWRNDRLGHYWSVYPGHRSAANFLIMYANPRMVFSSQLSGGIMYKMPKGYLVKGH